MEAISKEYKFAETLSIKESCKDFIMAVVSPGAPEAQRKDMGMAFMAGAYALYQMMLGDELNETEEKAEASMMNISNEFKEYFGRMKNAALLADKLNEIEKDLG